jgi:hypothetical protein
LGKAIKYNLAFCAVGDVGEKRTFDSDVNLKYFIHAVELLCSPNFPSFSCGTLETWCGPIGGGFVWPILRITGVGHQVPYMPHLKIKTLGLA